MNGKVAVDKKAEEYEAIYEHFDRLLTSGESYIDAAPFSWWRTRSWSGADRLSKSSRSNDQRAVALDAITRRRAGGMR